MKDKILNVIMGISILALIGAGYREYLIHNGKLTSDLNANGYSITNLPAGFFPAETDPTVSSWAKEPTPPLPPGFAAVSNAAMTVGAAATNYTDAAVGQVSSDVDAAARAATNYTDSISAALSAAIPTNNAQLANGAGYVTAAITNGLQLTETDPTVPEWAKAESAPMPGNYATVSNKAMSALQSFTETDPRFREWADAHVVAGGLMVDWASDAMYAQKLGGGFFTNYSADDITAISNGFAAADEVLSSRLSLASLAATNYTDFAIGAAIANTNPVFSNAVLSVGLGIDTDTVAAINALVEAGDELPIGGAATVGGLLLALAAAVAALKRTKADASALRYDLASETVISTASQETVEGETVNYGGATLADRTGNRVSITATLDELRVTFPPSVSGKLRDFGLRVEVGTGSAALTAPAIVPVAPTGETIKLENNAKQIPALADGAAAAKGVTLLYFSESAPGVFFAKGEQVREVA